MKKIVVIAPANSVITEKDNKLISLGVEKLEDIGFEVNFEKNVFSNNFYGYCSTTEQKVEDIYSIDNSKCDIVLCATGGINSNCILEYLDEKILKNKFDKLIFIGNSNNTILLNYLSSICNCRCYLGSNLKSLGKYDSVLSLKNLVEKVNNNPLVIFNNSLDVYRDGIVSGVTFGGNGSALRRLAGTRYFPKFENKIFVLEFNAKENSVSEVVSILSQYKQMGIFESISGLILGEYSSECSIIELVKPYIENTDYPVIISRDFGHNCDSTYIPIGTCISINTYMNEIKEVR